MTGTELVIVDTADRVRTVTLNRPEARNALSLVLQQAAAAALRAAEADPEVDVVILTGSDPAFCAGLDLKELGQGGRASTAGDVVEVSPFAALWAMTKPVIGAVNGACVTGGLELALACDFLVASERARFGDTHGRVGFTPAGGMSVFLPQAVGLRRAKELSLTGNLVDAAEAYRIGLVNHVVPHGELMATARRLAGDIVSCDQDAVRANKRIYDAGSRLAAGEAIAFELEVFRSRRLDAATIEARRGAIVERGRNR